MSYIIHTLYCPSLAPSYTIFGEGVLLKKQLYHIKKNIIARKKKIVENHLFNN